MAQLSGSDKNRVRFLSTSKWYRFILSKEGFQSYISLLVHLESWLEKKPSWSFILGCLIQFLKFHLAIREGSFLGLSSWFIWINLTTPTLIMKSWKIKIHFELFDQNKILILFEPSESVISGLSRSQSGNPMNHPPPFGAKPEPMNQLVSCHIGILPNTW